MSLPPPYRPFGIRAINGLGAGLRGLGLEFTETTRQRMVAFLAANPRGSRGVHKYPREDFGLDLGEIRERFREYCREFDVPLKA